MISRKHYFIGLIGLLFVFVVVSLFSVVYLTTQKRQSEYTNTNYRSLFWNPISGSSSSGVVKLSKRIRKGEYLSYRTSSGHTLISKFGSKEYLCTGTCDCGNEKRRVAVQRGVMFLFAGVSTALAIKTASVQFEKKCKLDLSDSCPPEHIISFSSECDEIISKPNEKSESKLFENEDDAKVKYFCSGECQAEGTYKAERWQEGDNEIQEICEKHIIQKDIAFRSKLSLSPDLENKKARKFFAHGHLVPYCRKTHPRCTGKIHFCRHAGISKMEDEFDNEDSGCQWHQCCESKTCGGDYRCGCGIDEFME